MITEIHTPFAAKTNMETLNSLASLKRNIITDFSRYSSSRTNRDTVYVANLLLGRLIKAGVCSESSKGYIPNNHVENNHVEVEKPKKSLQKMTSTGNEKNTLLILLFY
ncbi:MAG: hypothetical protein R3A80_08125 [Bdellovibrionota bacterium]